jgi:hypothetical protein
LIASRFSCRSSGLSLVVLRAEVTKVLWARKHEKMQRCEAIRQQHEQLRRGDGAEQSGRDQVIISVYRFVR